MVDEQITPSLDPARREVTSVEIRRRVLDPVDRASEILFGLIMVLTFTVSLNVTEAGRSDVRAMLVGALGCNLAWGLAVEVQRQRRAWTGSADGANHSGGQGY